MKVETYAFDVIPQFSSRDKDYQSNPQIFKDFIQYMPDEEGLLQAIHDRNKFPINRKLITSVFKKQYQTLSLSSLQVQNIESLVKENTFTVTCAHQPCLFTGPAYYVYKILSTIHLANDLSKKHAEFNFVPVFINGAEDHDFEEINHTTLFHKQVVWQTDQHGPVGRYGLVNLNEALDEMKNILGSSDEAIRILSYWQKALNDSVNYGEFMTRFLHYVFKDYGLLVLNMDDEECKRAFLPQIKQELIQRKSEGLVQTEQEKLQKLGYKPQAHARNVNLFYFSDEGKRERILFEHNRFSLSESEVSWSIEEILMLAEDHPDRFSPNVIMRPLYQESLLPDIAFIGGGGEIAYWMERKTLFQHSSVFFPVLIRRNSLFIVPPAIQKNLNKLNLAFSDFLEEEDKLIHRFIQEKDLKDNIFETERVKIEESLRSLSVYMSGFDHSLHGYMEAEKSKVFKMIDHAEQKLFRVIKQAEEVKIQQIKGIKAKLFPGNGLQERVDNYFQFHVNYQPNFLDVLLEELNPLEKSCKVLFL